MISQKNLNDINIDWYIFPIWIATFHGLTVETILNCDIAIKECDKILAVEITQFIYNSNNNCKILNIEYIS